MTFIFKYFKEAVYRTIAITYINEWQSPMAGEGDEVYATLYIGVWTDTIEILKKIKNRTITNYYILTQSQSSLINTA